MTSRIVEPLLFQRLGPFGAAFGSAFPAVVVTGARQTGKTTLLTKLFPDHHYVSLDLPA